MMTHIADAIIFVLGILVGWASGVEWRKEKNSKIMNELGAGLKQLRILAGDDEEGTQARLRLACTRRLAHVQGSGDARDAEIMMDAYIIASTTTIYVRGQRIDVRGHWPPQVQRPANIGLVMIPRTT